MVQPGTAMIVKEMGLAVVTWRTFSTSLRLLSPPMDNAVMSAPRDHHFVPAFYLRQWCNSVGKLVEYTIKQERLIPKPVGPNATGYQFDLYAFPELPPDQSQFIEQKFFDYADRTASDALKLHLTGNATGWTTELISAWSRFVIALHLRHPDAMPELRSAAQALWNGSGKASQQQYEQIRRQGDPATFDEKIACLDPLIPVKAQVSLIAKIFDNDIVGEHVNGMKPAILDVSASPSSLLTSDRPVGLFNIKAPTGIISLPISPTRLFVAVNDSKILEQLRQRTAREIVEQVNIQLTSRARRFVWSCDQSQTTFVQQYMSTRLEQTPFFPNIADYPDTVPSSGEIAV
jgi:hypothetical protein